MFTTSLSPDRLRPQVRERSPVARRKDEGVYPGVLGILLHYLEDREGCDPKTEVQTCEF